MAIRFKKAVTTKGDKPQTFKEGDEVDFYELYGGDEAAGANPEDADRQRRARAAASEQHYLRRGLAEAVEGKEPKTRKGVRAAPEKPAEDGAAEDKGGEKAGEGEKPDYQSMTAEELHKLAADRNIEGRAGLNKADTIKVLEKDDRKRAAKK
jgi:hypothetical protein